MLPNTTPAHYERVREQALKIRAQVTEERNRLFRVQKVNDNIFSYTQDHPVEWMKLASTIHGFADNFPADSNTLKVAMTNTAAAVESLAITLEHRRERAKKELIEDVNYLKNTRKPGLLVARQKLDSLFGNVITEKQKLEKQISDIKSDKGFYVTKERRAKDLQSKIDKLVFVRAEEAVVELCLRYTLHTLTAVDRVINDFQYVNLDVAGIPVFPEKVR